MSCYRAQLTFLWLSLLGVLLSLGLGCGGSEAAPIPPTLDAAPADTAPVDTAPEPETTETDLTGVDADTNADANETDGGVDLREPCAKPGAWGCDCQSDTECDSASCVPGPDGHRCALSCAQGCPPGWRCASLTGNQEAITDLCIPVHAALCRPCETDADCEQGGDPSARCIEHATGAGFYCGAHCDAMSPCPTDYECVELAEEDAISTSQCAPTDGAQCACNGLASDEEASTSCSLTNLHGSCWGTRTCGETGLSDCSAQTPGAEVCDGIDNNCDGETDEALGTLSCGQGVCETTLDACTGGVPAQCEPDVQSGETDETCNGLDDDCDGETDEELGSLSCGIGLCKTSVPACSQGGPNDCEPLFQPGEITESCNGIDDDCDGETDEGLTDCD